MKTETLEPHMIDAIQAVLTQGIAIREAARKYNVPRTTLQRKIQRVEAAGGLAKVVEEQSHSRAAEIMRMATSPPPQSSTGTTSATGHGTGVASPLTASAAASNPVTPGMGSLTASMLTSIMSPQKDGGSRTNSVSSSSSQYSASAEIKDTRGVSPTAAQSLPVVISRKRPAEAMEGFKAEAPSTPTPAAMAAVARSPTSAPGMTNAPPSPTALSCRMKGPRKAINGKIRMLCHSAGSALDQLSNELIREGKSVYKLGLGQSPFPVPQCIVDELRYVEIANAHQRDYLPVAGLPELCEDIAAWGARALHLPYSKDDVLVGPGTKELLFVLQTVYYGDLLLPNPSCTSYAPQANIAGRNMFWLPTYAEDRWVLRPEILEEHCAKDPEAPRILILNSPSNPTGCVYHEDELQAVADIARKYRMLVISDEIYSELHHSTDHVSISRFYPEGTIVSGGLSKWCGAGGWRMGFWLFPNSMSWLRKSMLVMASETYTSVASPIQYAARRAFVLDCIELTSYKLKCCKILKIIGQWCHYQLQKMAVDAQVPEGGFYLFPSFAPHRKVLADRGITTDVELCHRLLHDTGVALLPGSAFGRSPYELYARIAFVDFKGDIALYLIESMDNLGLEAVDAFIQSVCPNIDVAMRRLASWIANPPMPTSPSSGASFASSGLPVVPSALLATPQISTMTSKSIDEL